MHHTALVLRLFDYRLYVLGVTQDVDSGRLAFLFHRKAAPPHNIVDRRFLDKNHGFFLIQVHQRHQSGEIKSEEIKESGILTVRIRIVGIIHSCLIIAQEEQKTGLMLPSHFLQQPGPSVDISLFCKHGKGFTGLDFKFKKIILKGQ